MFDVVKEYEIDIIRYVALAYIIAITITLLSV